MSVIFVLLPVAVVLGVAFVAMFVWATRDGQFDDMKTPQIRVLFDDEETGRPSRSGSDRKNKERA